MRVGFRWRAALSGLGLTLACLVLGGVVGLASVALHQSWGLLALAALTCLVVLAALPRAWWSRPPFVVGFALVVLRAVVPRPEGDFLVAADATGYALMGLTLGLVVAGVAGAPRRAAGQAPRPTPGPTEVVAGRAGTERSTP